MKADGSEGFVPTGTFKRIFISRSGSYADHGFRKTFKRSGGACYCHAMVAMTSLDVSQSVQRLSSSY